MYFVMSSHQQEMEFCIRNFFVLNSPNVLQLKLVAAVTLQL